MNVCRRMAVHVLPGLDVEEPLSESFKEPIYYIYLIIYRLIIYKLIFVCGIYFNVFYTNIHVAHLCI